MHSPRPLAAALLAVAALGAAPPAEACSTFCSTERDRTVCGKNYDWDFADGHAIVNPRGLARVALATGGGEPARWTATYGSVSFNQYGRDFPAGGINEAGLVVEVMWLAEARYPNRDRRPSLATLQWIQYQLDTAATVVDVLASDAEVRIGPQGVPLHFLVADRTGAVATVEFLDGRLVAHTGATLPVAALTNSPYADSVAFSECLEAAGQPAPAGHGSLARFARLGERLADPSTGRGSAVDRAFATLAEVAAPRTQWTLVYELDRPRVHFRTRGRPKVKTLDLSRLSFDCSEPAKFLDLATPAAGDATAALVPYRYSDNLALVRAAYRQTDFLAETPEEELERVARTPDGARCTVGGAATVP